MTCYRLRVALLMGTLKDDSTIRGRCRRHCCDMINALWVMSFECKEDVFEIQGTCLLDRYIDIVHVGTFLANICSLANKWVFFASIWEGEASLPRPL